MLRAYFRSGITADLPTYLQNRLLISNYLSVFIVGIGLSYTVFTYFLYPEITYIPALAVAAVGFAVLLNYQGMAGVYRLILSLMPVIVTASYQSYLVPAGGEPIPASMMLLLAFSLLPFLMFDLREKGYLYSMLIINLLVIVSVPYTLGWLESTADSSFFREGIMYHITVISGSLMAFGSLLVLASVNLQAEEKGEELIHQANENAALMEIKEKDLENNLKKLEQAQVEDKLRSWASEGFSKFGDLLRNQQEEGNQYDMLISSIVNYLKVNQGGLYLLEEEGDKALLELKSCYAYGRKKFHEKRIEIGQGLVGQCYREKDYIHLTELPDRYTHISSGLGDATPTAIILIPLIANEKVEGVLELAAFQKFEAYQIDFLMKLGEDIAATVNVSRVNELTRRLLNDAQQQTEEMRAQEEEMRQNMEELSATQEEMQRKESEYMREIERLKEALQAKALS